MGMMLGPASALGLQPPVELGQAGEPEPRLEEAASDCLDLLLDLALLPSRRRRAGGRLDHVMIGHDQEAAVEHTLLAGRSEEHTSELQSLMRISYAVFCLKKKKNENKD